ncbi:hypothetical protein [Halobacteriovorax sp. RT-1-4]|uniref:hypothetical protein n=1 Tax=unclassified Halobacteriovorax TaxID=2639665 RepID=UPI00399BBABC
MMRSIAEVAKKRNVVLLAVMAMAANAHAGLPSGLPDEIDYRTYLSAYNSAKSQSDAARMSATQISDLILEIVARLEANGSEISISKREIEEAILLVSDLSTQNMNLETTISELSFENQGLEQELQRLADSLSDVNGEINRTESDLSGPRNTARNLKRALDSVLSSLRANGDRLDKAQKKLDRTRDQIKSLESNISKAIDERDRLNIKLPKIQEEIKSKKQDLAQATSKVSTFESQVVNARTKLQTANTEVSEAQAQVTQIENKISKQEQAVKPLVQKRSNLQSQLSTAQTALSAKTSELEKAKRELESAKSQIDGLKSQRGPLASQKTNLDNKRSVLEAEMVQVEEALKTLMAGDRNDRGNANQIKNLRERRKILRDKIQETKTRLTQVSTELEQLAKKIAKAESTISGGSNQIAILESEINTKKGEVRSLRQDIKDVEAEIAQAAPQLEKLKQRLVAAQNSLNSAKTAQASAKSDLDKAQAKLALVKSDIKRLEGDIASLQDQKQKASQRVALIDSDLKKFRNELNREKNQFDSQRREVGSLRNTQNALVAERDSYERRLSVVESDIKLLVDRLDSLHVTRLELEEQSQARSERLVANQNIIADSSQRIMQNSSVIASKRSQMASNEDRIADLEVERSRLLEDKLVKEQEFARADTVASDLENITNNKYQAYQGRSNLYVQYERDAKALGASQGEAAGATAGEYKASADVQEDASFFGGANGKKLGELRGYLAGLVDGKEDGLTKGYEAGVNSQASYDEGFAKGYEAGVAKAKSLAKSQEFPKGYEQVKSETFSNKPTNRVMLSNSVNGSLFLEKAFSMAQEFVSPAFEALDFVAPEYTATTESLGSRFTSKVDQEIAKTQREIESYENDSAKTKALPQYAYTAPTRIDIDEDFKNCFDVYKGVNEFKKACGASYDAAYKAEFSVSHKDTYFAGYVDFFESSRDEAAAGNFEAETQKGFDKAYKTAFAEARLEGEGVAFKNGVADGEEAGFDENIQAAKEEMLALGKAQAKKLFASNAVVRLNQAAQTSVKTEDAKGLTQDGKFSVGLGLVNFGKLASNRGAISAKVVAATSNVEIVNSRTNLRVLPAQAQIELTDVIQAKVANNARPGSDIEMKIELTYPGDELSGSYTEIATFNANVVVNPEVQVALDFEDKVKDRKCALGLFNCKFRSHDVKVKLTGLRDFVPGSYDVAISVLEGDKFVELKKGSTKVAAPGRGVTATGALTYKFKKKTKDDKLKFKVDVSYKGELLQSKVIDVKAK